MDEELRRYIRGELRSIRIELKKRYDVIVAKNDLNAISAAVLDKQAREFYVPVGIALADRTQQEKSPTNLEDAVIQPELEKLNQLVTDYSNNCIRKLINGRKPRTISKNMDYYPGGQRYCVNQ